MQRQLRQELAQGSMRDPGLVRDLKEAIEPLAAIEKGLLDERRALRALLQTQAAGELGGTTPDAWPTLCRAHAACWGQRTIDSRGPREWQ